MVYIAENVTSNVKYASRNEAALDIFYDINKSHVLYRLGDVRKGK